MCGCSCVRVRHFNLPRKTFISVYKFPQRLTYIIYNNYVLHVNKYVKYVTDEQRNSFCKKMLAKL